MSADAYTALPIYALGNEYFAMSYIYKGSSSIRQGPSELGLIAVYDSTRIEIILPWDGFVISFPGYDVRRSGRQLSLRLNRFETYQVSSEGIQLVNHTHTHARMHARTHARKHARTHARTHARKHARTHFIPGYVPRYRATMI